MEKEQKIQEESYKIPYHWFMKSDNFNERVYFGYLSICLSLLDNWSEEDFENKKVLDAGCGDGYFLHSLKKRGIKCLYGADYSERAISFAKIFIPDAEIKVANLFKLPYENNFFDVIFVIEVLEHIQLNKMEDILKEIKRVLKKDAQLVITVPSKLMPIDKKHYQHFSENSLRKCLEPLFVVKEMYGQDRLISKMFGFLYKIIDNRYWILKPLSKYYNMRIWPKFFNKCDTKQGKRLIAFCVNK